MIELKKLRELVKLMKENDLTELDLQGESERVTLKRAAPNAPVQYVQAPAAVPSPGPAAPAAPPPSAAEAPAAPKEEEGMTPILSPMVGTFYSAPSPDAEPFVKPGDRVSADTVVCLVEAMKVFNEIKAETSGTLQKVMVESGQPVEYDQPLFYVKPG